MPSQPSGGPVTPEDLRRRRMVAAIVGLVVVLAAMVVALVVGAPSGDGEADRTATDPGSATSLTTDASATTAAGGTPSGSADRSTTTRPTSTTSASIPGTATTATPTAGGSTVPPRGSGDLRGRTIVIDPGHNGANGSHPAEINRLVDAGGFRKPCNTTGTAEGGLTESAFNWQTAQRLRDELERRGATVVLTRTSDDGWGPCVDQRGLTAQRADADAIVSIHADGAAASARGFHVIHAATGPTVSTAVDAASAELADRVRDRLEAAGFRRSTYVGGGTGTVRRTDIATLNRAGVPGVMLESGNMHNPDDLARLRSADGQQAIATALAGALTEALAR